MGLVKDHSYRSPIKLAVANGGNQKILCNFSMQVVVEGGSEVKVVLLWDRLSWVLFIHLPLGADKMHDASKGVFSVFSNDKNKNYDTIRSAWEFAKK